LGLPFYAKEQFQGAAIISSGIALVGIFLSTQLTMPWTNGTASILFKEGLTTQQLEEVIDRIEQPIQTAVPSVKRMFIEVESLKKLV
jgi:divalent metal cation (Fe/Co/Zn/Cd) transporter